MTHSSLQSTIQIVVDKEASSPWQDHPIGGIALLLERTAELFVYYGDPLAYETAERMGVTPSEVYFEAIFPAVWGALSLCKSLRRADPNLSLRQFLRQISPLPLTDFAGLPACQLLPANRLEKLLLPGVKGYVLFNEEKSPNRLGPADPQGEQENDNNGIALCLLPFNLVSIRALDVLHLLCNQGRRVIAKVSEKAGFGGPYLEKIFSPFVEQNALSFVYGGPDTGALLVEQPIFDTIHVTGSIPTGNAIKQAAGSRRMTMELGGVTAAIVFPDVFTRGVEEIRQVARQIAYGTLANNGQHCVSYQIVVVPEKCGGSLKTLLWEEILLAAGREGEQGGNRLLIDSASASRLEKKVAVLSEAGASVLPPFAKLADRGFPATLIAGIDAGSYFLREEAFGPVAALLTLPDDSFARDALDFANSSALAGDLGISLFTADPLTPEMKRMAAELRHGVVAMNAYPGIAFATSLPWGAGPLGLSGEGWSHNYRFLPENEIRKVVLVSPLGKKKLGPLQWEDPWLLNVSGESSFRLAKGIVRSSLAFFQGRKWELFKAQLELFRALFQRETQARTIDRRQHLGPS
ncbi:MAG: aldehyde dehydrogenase family protein [Terriglobia bacterium]